MMLQCVWNLQQRQCTPQHLVQEGVWATIFSDESRIPLQEQGGSIANTAIPHDDDVSEGNELKRVLSCEQRAYCKPSYVRLLVALIGSIRRLPSLPLKSTSIQD
jgi:hypothetical protein